MANAIENHRRHADLTCKRLALRLRSHDPGQQVYIPARRTLRLNPCQTDRQKVTIV